MGLIKVSTPQSYYKDIGSYMWSSQQVPDTDLCLICLIYISYYCLPTYSFNPKAELDKHISISTHILGPKDKFNSQKLWTEDIISLQTQDRQPLIA